MADGWGAAAEAGGGMSKARVLLADPAWKFGDALPGKTRGASKQYRTLSVSDIARFPLPELADSAVLFLWRVAAMQEEALFVCRAWGFKPKTEIIWRKLTRTGKEHFGMGRLVRASHETCLVATRGKPPIRSHSVRSVFAAPVQEHSRKPDEFYELIEGLCPGPYAELFARRVRAGWAQFGDQLPQAAE